MLASYYLIFTIVDCLLMIVGNSLFRKDSDFYCFNDSTVIPESNAGAGYMMVYTILILLYSLMVWFVFYKVPESYKLISNLKDRL